MDLNANYKVGKDNFLTLQERDIIRKVFNEAYMLGKKDGKEGVFLSKNALDYQFNKIFLNIELIT